MRFVIVFDRKSSNLRVEAFRDGPKAFARRFELEREHADDKDVEIVVISAPSIKVVKQTHPRYFRKERRTRRISSAHARADLERQVQRAG